MLRGVALVALCLAACGGKLGSEGNVATRTIGTEEGPPDAPAPVDGGTLVVSPGTGVANAQRCGGSVTPSTASFEPGAATDFDLAVPGLVLDSASPIAGTESAKIDASVKGSYLAKHDPGVCTTTVTLTVRASADVLASGLTLVRIDADDRELLLVVDPGGGVQLAQQATGDQGSAYQPGRVVTMLAADVATRIALAVDLTRAATTLSIVPQDDAHPQASDAQALMGGVGTPHDVEITEVDIGTAPSAPGEPAESPSGVYWLDDLLVQ